MAPFPEAEIMTIKRLEVALRKMDFKLLKDGAYKLHEKYHGGHRFEYLDLLQDILVEILNNPTVPADVKDILCPTIQDILAQNNENIYQPEPTQIVEVNQAPIQESSTLINEEIALITDEPVEQIYAQNINTFEQKEETSASQFDLQPETKISAFEAFSPQRTQEESQVAQQPQRFFTQSPFSAEPFKEFNMPTAIPTEVPSEIPSVIVENIQPVEALQKEEKLFETPIQQKEIYQEPSLAPVLEQPSEVPTETKEEEIQIPQEKKSISIVYCQDNSNEKIKNISKFREIIENSREKISTIDDLMALISEITTQADTNVIELQGIFKHLSASGNKTKLITNSQSEMLVELLDSLELDYELFKNDEIDKLNLLPLYGLSSLFACAECGQTYLNKTQELKPLVLECPQCKNPMYPDFWVADSEAKLNLEYYNKALVNLANSKVWLVIHPSFSDKTTSQLIESALRVSSNVEEIYVLDKDINIRENYKTFISKIKPNVKVNAHNNTLEEFFKAI